MFLSSVERTGHAPLTEPPPAAARWTWSRRAIRAPDVRLTDEAGATRALSEWRGRALAVTFIYTRCPLPDFCPRMDRQFAAVQREILADERLRDRVRLLSVSVDPAFDTPQVLAATRAPRGRGSARVALRDRETARRFARSRRGSAYRS